jgi:hypothetical protein
MQSRSSKRETTPRFRLELFPSSRGRTTCHLFIATGPAVYSRCMANEPIRRSIPQRNKASHFMVSEYATISFGDSLGVDYFDTHVQFCNAQKRTDELKSHLCWNSNSSVNGLKDCRFRDVQASLGADDCRHNSFFRNTLSQLPAICLFSLPAPDHKAPLLCLRPRFAPVKRRCVH